MNTQSITLQVPADATIGLFISESQRRIIEIALHQLNGLRFSPVPGLLRGAGISAADDMQLTALLDMLSNPSAQTSLLDCTEKGES